MSWTRPAGLVLAAASAAGAGRPADPQAEARRRMVASQIEARGVRDPRVLEALRRVPRHRFVPADQQASAHDDHPLPIGEGQTISQPYIVAAMTELLRIEPGDKVLEIGTGSGYQAAVLAELGAKVWSIEIVEPLARKADRLLAELGYKVHVIVGDGYRGLPAQGPFDAILLTAAPPSLPAPLVEQLAVGGVLVAPVGEEAQDLVTLTRSAAGVEKKVVFPVRFVPMTGEAQR